MNWEAIGAIGEVFGALAVVLTLIFLVVELRENRKVAQSAAVDALGDGWNKLNCVVMADPELNAIWFKGMNDPNSLDPDKLDRFMMVCQSYVNQFMTVKNIMKRGISRKKNGNIIRWVLRTL